MFWEHLTGLMEPASAWFKTTVTGGCIAWNSNGFTIKGNNDTRYTVNNSINRDMTGMSFKTSDTGVTNTDGTITSTVWANPDFGVSKIKYHGYTMLTGTDFRARTWHNSRDSAYLCIEMSDYQYRNVVQKV